MTDNDIIQALEKNLELMLYEGDLQRASTISEALDPIKRQKAAIESYENCERILICQLAEEREKAIKEFAERLRMEADGYDFCGDGIVYQMVGIEDIDNLVKEMVGEE